MPLRRNMQEEEYTIPQMVENVRDGKMGRRQLMKKLTAMGISAAGIGAIVATSKSSSATAPLHVLAAGQTAKHIQLHDQHLTNQSQGNTDALSNDYADHAIVEDSMHTQPFVGR